MYQLRPSKRPPHNVITKREVPAFSIAFKVFKSTSDLSCLCKGFNRLWQCNLLVSPFLHRCVFRT